jgi:hypothetical protein
MDEKHRCRPRFQFGLRTILILAVICGVVALLSLTGPTSTTNFGGVKPGMSRDEVRAILGEPDELQHTGTAARTREIWRYGRYWINWSDDIRYEIHFNHRGKVTTAIHLFPEPWNN